jgi:hypothetical protein
MSVLTARLEVATSYELGEAITVNCQMRNNSNIDVRVLRWNTPLEGLFSDCLRVTFGDNEVEYDGPFAKRVEPSPESYVLISAGKTVSVSFDLEQAYPIRESGRYSVQVRARIEDIVFLDLDAFEVRIMGVSGATVDVDVEWGGAVEFSVSGNPALRKPTEGEIWRERYDYKHPVSPTASSEVALDPIVEGGTPKLRQIVIDAHKRCFSLCEYSLAILSNDGRYSKWFGKFAVPNFAIVKKTFTAMRNRMTATRFTYVIESPHCRDDFHAVTFAHSSSIGICRLFWKDDPLAGPNSQWGIVLHEHSHATASTQDFAKNPNSCKQLAIIDPGRSIKNAASFQFFSEGV